MSRASTASSMVTAAESDGKVFYRPRTNTTREAYDIVLGVIHDQLGGQAPEDVVKEKTHQVMQFLSRYAMASRIQRYAMEKIVGPMSDFVFHRILKVGYLMWDYPDWRREYYGQLDIDTKSERIRDCADRYGGDGITNSSDHGNADVDMEFEHLDTKSKKEEEKDECSDYIAVNGDRLQKLTLH